MTDISGAMEFVDIVFDGPPSHESGRFVEVEDATGHSINIGEWVQRADGYWALRISRALLSSHPQRDGEGNRGVDAAASPVDPWQPISTAPKGVKILLAYRNRLGKWRRVLGRHYEEGTLESDHEESGFAPPDWYEATEAYDEISLLDESPTHWMSLAAPPGADANQQSKTSGGEEKS